MNVQFVCSVYICKIYFVSWLVHDNLTLPWLDRLFQVIEHIDDVLALLNLVSLVRQAGWLTSRYRSLKCVCEYPEVSTLNSITLDIFPSQEIAKIFSLNVID